MANNSQSGTSERAVQYLNQDKAVPEARRPAINVPIDNGYSLHRFLNPHSHAEDKILRPLDQFRTALTEDQARERMAAILAAATHVVSPRGN